MSYKSDLKALQAPDTFQKTGGQFRDWVMAHEKLVLPALGGVLAVSFAVALFSYVHQRHEDQARLELGEKLKILERPVGTASQPLEDAPETEGTPFASQQVKDQDVQKTLEAFRLEKAGSSVVATAELPLGQAQLRLGQADAALPLFSDYVQRTPLDNPLRVLALEGEGYAHEAKGEYAQAQASFERMNAENKSEFLNGMGLYHRARMLLLQGKKQEAAAAFSEVSVLAPMSAASRLAGERAASLAQQGIVAPPPVVNAAAPDAGHAP